MDGKRLVARSLAGVAALLVCAQGAMGAGVEMAKAFEGEVRPVLQAYCYRCHGGEKTKGDLNLAQVATGARAMEMGETWSEVVKKLSEKEMPPKSAKQPSEAERARVVAWAKAAVKAGGDCGQIANDKNSSFYRGYVMSRRLTRQEYNNTIRDLVGVNLKVGEMLPADGAGGEGFENNGDTLYTSPILLEKYMRAAGEVALWMGKNRREEGWAVRASAKQELGEFMARAFRRPVGDAEVERYMKLWDRGGMELAIKGVLVSPNFLFLVEPDEGKTGVYALDDYCLATRLSYFIWASMPDAELTRLSREGKLHEEEVLRGQVRRMLQDEKARGLAEVFGLQWLGIGELSGKVDGRKFPEFDEELAGAMREEAIQDLTYVIRQDRSVLELIGSDYTFVNERLARHYGIAGVSGPQMRKVMLKDANRGGVLGMASVLTQTSYPLRTSPVLRGKWVLETLLGTRIPPPPPTAGTLPPDDATRGGQTFRQQLEAHRRNPECASCHSKMDPLGFGLENFDPTGRWRDSLNGEKIDASGVLPGGEKFAGPAQLKKVLLERRDEFAHNLAKKMLGYALGRGLNKFDQCVVQDAQKAMKENNYRIGSLVETIALSKPFRYRFSAK